MKKKSKAPKRETWAAREKHEELAAYKDGSLGRSPKAKEATEKKDN